MKIGILTYHRAENYGALLQAYGLMTYLQSLGHSVSFVDYWPDYHRHYFSLFSLKRFWGVSIRSKAVMLYNLVFWNGKRKKRKQNLQLFINDRLNVGVTPKYTSSQDICCEYDVVFYGSDQIWRKQGMPDHKGFDEWYLGSSNIIAKKIAYAASMGKINLNEFEKEDFKEKLSQFSSIAVREESLKQFITSLGIKSQLVIDPTFLLTKEEWEKLIVEKCHTEKYILVYNLLNNPETVAFAERLSKEKHLPIIEISKKYSFTTMSSRYNHTATVEDFLALIHDAQYVVSNSFHGVAFSIIFQKQFYAVGMGDRADRVKSILKLLNISERYTENNSCLINEIDYKSVLIHLKKQIQESKKFIASNLV